MAEFLIPRTVPKVAGAPVTALDPDDLRDILRHARGDRLLAAAVERELRRRTCLARNCQAHVAQVHGHLPLFSILPFVGQQISKHRDRRTTDCP